MRWLFDVSNAAPNNEEAAYNREAELMALIAWNLLDMGEEVVVSGVARLGLGQMRIESMKPLLPIVIDNPAGRFAVRVVAAESPQRPPNLDVFNVGIKTSGGIEDDEVMAQAFDCLMATACHEKIKYADNLIASPLPIHQYMRTVLWDASLYAEYVRDDLEPIRKKYVGSDARTIPCGFCGSSKHGRPELSAKMPDWCTFRLGGTVDAKDRCMSPWEYLRWMAKLDYGIVFPGERPKSYRFSELCMLGIPRVMTHAQALGAYTPDVTATNTCLIDDWDDHEGLGRRGIGAKIYQSVASMETHRENLVAEQDESYKEGWSIRGRAKLLKKFVEGRI